VTGRWSWSKASSISATADESARPAEARPPAFTLDSRPGFALNQAASKPMQIQLGWTDYLILLVYFAFVIASVGPSSGG